MRKLAIAILVILALLIPVGTAAGLTVKNEQVSPGDYYVDWITGMDKDYNLKVDMTSDKAVDVFIFSYNMYWGPYKNNSNFIPTYQMLNTTAAKFTWVCPDDQTYCLVIDNRLDNITGSATPSGGATISYTRSDPLEKALEELGNAISTVCIAAGAIVVIIIVVIIVVYVMAARKKKAQPLQPLAPAPAYGQPQFGQPGYGQPPQQSYQPPPGQYQPPPPPPGSL
jgi:predicted PurR-regulated permease PerM